MVQGLEPCGSKDDEKGLCYWFYQRNGKRQKLCKKPLSDFKKNNKKFSDFKCSGNC